MLFCFIGVVAVHRIGHEPRKISNSVEKRSMISSVRKPKKRCVHVTKDARTEEPPSLVTVYVQTQERELAVNKVCILPA